MDEVSRPACIGIIMDGNRRWAKEKGLQSFEGHRAGYNKLEEVVRWARDAGISHVVAYAFSTENWQRSEREVGYLMTLFRSVLEKETEKLIRERVRVRFVGETPRFSEDMRNMMERMERATGAKYDITLHLLMSYGGRAEITAAVNSLLAEDTPRVNEEAFAQTLWSSHVPDPDVIIRTGGEKRLSNFLPWQSVYSELFFSDTLWPDFTKTEFDLILNEFAKRERRRGK